MLTSVPNLLTYLRIALIPGLVGSFYLNRPLANWLALAFFAVAGITDFLDGYLARAMAQQSPLGRMLDPIADKLLVSAALLMLVGKGTIAGPTLLAAVVILCREITVSGLREFLAEADVGVPVTTLAKWKTMLQMVAIGFLLAGPAGEAILPGTVRIGEAGLWLAAVLTLYTGYDYLLAGMRHAVNPETARRAAEKRARMAASAARSTGNG
jgi:cardiolipin synthase